MRLSEQIAALRTKRAERLNQMDEILAAAERGKRDLSADEMREFNNCKGQIERIDAELTPLLEAQMRAGATATDAYDLGSLGIGGPPPFQAGAGQRQTAVAQAIHASGFLTRIGSDFVGRAQMQIAVRSLLETGVIGVALPPTGLDTVSGYASTYGRLLSYMPSIPVSGPSIVYNRLVYAAGSPKAATIPEGTAKPHSDVESVPATVVLPTWAHWEKVSTQLLQDGAQSINVLEMMLTEALLDKIDAGGYATMTSGGNFDAFTPGAGYSAFDSAVGVATQLAKNGARQIVVALNPTDAAAATLTKSAAGGAGMYVGSPIPAASSAPAFTLVQSSTVAPTKVLGFDRSGAGPQYADRQVMNVMLGLDGSDFTTNLRTLLCEARGVVIVRDPKRVVYGAAAGA